MKLTILISTMNESIQPLYERLVKLPKHIDVVICHQITNNTLDAQELKNHIESIRPNISVLQKYEKGLSKSRNCALSHVQEGICLITDDDVEFLDDLYEKITDAYQLYPNADIITFQAKTPEGGFFNSYHDSPFKHTLKSTAKVSSIEMSFKIKSIKYHNLYFNEDFGLGTTYPTGEEFIFLTDAIKKDLHLQYHPSALTIHPSESSGMLFNTSMLLAKGAMIHKVFGFYGYFVSLIFAVKKYPLYKKECTFFDALKLMNQGKNKI
jgi:glycosyltransferase involved in cell wall biosynthesis